MQLKVPPSRNVQVAQNIRTEWMKDDLRPNITTEALKADRGDQQFVNDEILNDRLDPAGRKTDRAPQARQTPTRGQLQDFDLVGETLVEASNLSRGSPKQNRIITRSEFDALILDSALRRAIRRVPSPKP